MKNIFALFNNFLTSGHSFSDDEYSLKSKFVLINSMISVAVLFISALTIILVFKNNFNAAFANLMYLILGIISIVSLRYYKYSYKYIILLIPFISMILLITLLYMYPNDLFRFSWFFVIIIVSFFLGGRKLGYISSFISILCIQILQLMNIIDLSLYMLILISTIIILDTLAIDFYEKREAKLKRILINQNLILEDKIKAESTKRIKVYKESNLELQNSAKKIKEQKEAYKYLAHYDMLTKLPNRIFFIDRLEHAIDKAKRNKSKLAILFFDLDNFKEINDSLGHHIGDEVLKIVAKRLEISVRKSDTVARLGGDEFTLLMEDLDDVFKIAEISKELIKTISQPMYIKKNELYVSVSIGASFYPDDGLDSKSLLRCADSAMYSAKKAGNNLFHFYKPEMTEQAVERVTLETSIRKGIEKDEFVVYYQPIVDVHKNETIGLEALIRWEHPELGLLSPDKFIHVAESSSLIIELGEVVLEKVSNQLIQWHQEGLDPKCISVNLSVKQLRQSTLVDTIEKTLNKIYFRDNWLQLEITEGYAMQRLDHAIKVLQKIRDLGVTLAVDDFGTGYSSLSYLKKLPVNRLKIDKSFINDIPGDSDDEALVRAIVAMAKSMHLGVVAEGVETKEQEKFLLNAGCHTMQGYLYAKPMEANKLKL